MNDISLNIYGQDLSEGGKQPVLIPFLTDDPAGKITVVIIPGGGYNHISLEKEGEAIAGAFNAMQVNAFVLDYRVPARRADFLSDAVRAVQYVRFHSENFGISRNPLIVMGFSAGAHLALRRG